MLWIRAGFQNILTTTNSFLESLHDLIIVWLVVILIVVILVGGMILSNHTSTHQEMDSPLLEVIWTIIPIFILIRIAFPRIYLLCLQDTRVYLPKTTLKLIRNQWNWQREILEVSDHLLDLEILDILSSYSSPVPLSLISTRILVSSSDVLHSLGIPRLGIKLDSNPGRLNATMVEPSSLGLLLGSCYELCGRGHSAIPIFLIVLYFVFISIFDIFYIFVAKVF